VKIGSWFKDCDKIQKSVRRDPFPHVPFHDAQFPFPSKGEMTVIIVLIVLFIVLWVAV